jgi:hypothetical protein
MDGMTVAYYPLVTGGRGDYTVSNTINLPSPTSVIAEISLSGFDAMTANETFDASGLFYACTTNGADGLPTSENFEIIGTTSGFLRTAVIRNGLTSISYELYIRNCDAYFVINVFFWPSVNRGNL